MDQEIGRDLTKWHQNIIHDYSPGTSLKVLFFCFIPNWEGVCTFTIMDVQR